MSGRSFYGALRKNKEPMSLAAAEKQVYALSNLTSYDLGADGITATNTGASDKRTGWKICGKTAATVTFSRAKQRSSDASLNENAFFLLCRGKAPRD